MARSPKIVMKGDKALIRKLRRLGDRRKLRKVLRSATTASAQEVVKGVRKIWRAEANDTGLSAKSVTKKVLKTKAGFTAIIGIDKDASAPRIGRSQKLGNAKQHVPANIDHLIELGFQHANGKTVPAVAPLRRGYEASKKSAEDVFARKAAQAIEREASRR